MPEQDHSQLVETTAQIVSAYLANNPTPMASIADLVANVSTAVGKLSAPIAEPAPPRAPAVNPKRSVHPDYIISLEDGSKYKSIKRHLMAKHGMTPAEYRAKWGLPHDYPMVTPNYAAARSALAKKLGLGRKPKSVAIKSKPRRKAAVATKAVDPKPTKRKAARKPAKSI